MSESTTKKRGHILELYLFTSFTLKEFPVPNTIYVEQKLLNASTFVFLPRL